MSSEKQEIEMSDGTCYLSSKRQAEILHTVKNISNETYLNVGFSEIKINGMPTYITSTKQAPTLKPGETAKISAKFVIPKDSALIFADSEANVTDLRVETRLTVEKALTKKLYESLPDWV